MSLNSKTVSREDWLAARKALLEKEKAFTRARDALSRQRRELPWVRIEKNYVFEGPDGRETLADLFDGRSQLIVYHFMFGADWEEGCKSCSYIADHFNPAIVHLNQRDVTFVAASTAPLSTLEAFKARMGWSFKWVSAGDCDFNQDYRVTYTQAEIDAGESDYNFGSRNFRGREAPGASVFYKDADGQVFHTYSVFERGLDMFITAYHYLDIVPKGRGEEGLDFTMSWLRLHDAYGD